MLIGVGECIYQREWHNSKQSHTRDLSVSSTNSVDFITRTKQQQQQTNLARSTQDDAKLIFGIVFSLRNMVRKLTDEDGFVSYNTTKYKLHYFETPTNLKFVLLTDPKMENQRLALQQIFVSLYTEYVVKNPLSPIEQPPEGITNELFVLGLDAFITSLPGFD
ncbi:hypothetical protein TRICI_000936 [Trichomonascus ciferrii]|uniref:Trafficking protein particle complex subunit n=1 Tax=Trichomonascus ciferrii TaxID=44093 RepID=A0A642VB36_9ASCO|nr:hypothetical protein TRICI_000936 [Trichomonascus ciferrii]